MMKNTGCKWYKLVGLSLRKECHASTLSVTHTPICYSFFDVSFLSAIFLWNEYSQCFPFSSCLSSVFIEEFYPSWPQWCIDVRISKQLTNILFSLIARWYPLPTSSCRPVMRMSLVLEVYDHLFVCSFLSCYFLLVLLLVTISVLPCRRCLLHFSLKHDKDCYLTRFLYPCPLMFSSSTPCVVFLFACFSLSQFCGSLMLDKHMHWTSRCFCFRTYNLGSM